MSTLFLRNLQSWAKELEIKFSCPVEISRDKTGYVFIIQTKYNISIPKLYRSIPVRQKFIVN